MNIESESLIGIDNEDEYIYRIFPFQKIIEIFQNKELVLVTPELWDDPYENFFLKSEIFIPVVNEENVLIDFKSINSNLMYRTIFGQCWSLQHESDAMWRIYSGDSLCGVKVKTTIKKLISELKKAKCNEFSSIYPYIGRVSYQENEMIEKFNETIDFAGNIFNEMVLKPLLIKRKEFAHEKEIRILCCIDHETEYEIPNDCFKTDLKTHKILHLQINPEKIFDEIVLDPRLSDEEFFKLKKELEKHTGSKIEKSKLYDAPKMKYVISTPIRKLSNNVPQRNLVSIKNRASI